MCQNQRKDDQNSARIDNLELLIGDCLGLVCFATYKQLISIVTSPAFPGWLAPLHFNPLRFEEFFSFVVTLTGSWVCSGVLLGAYATPAGASVKAALLTTSKTWIATVCVSAAQLILLTAAEDGALVGDFSQGFGRVLPLAASGPGEPFVTGAQILGLMAVWRAFYATYLDMSKFLSIEGARSMDDGDAARHFQEALLAAGALAAGSCLLLHLITVAFPDLGY